MKPPAPIKSVRSKILNSNRRWVNQYVELSESKPGRLMACLDGPPSKADLELIQSEVALADKHGMKILVELGSGSGGYILQFAEANRDWLCLAFELRFKRAYRTAEKAEEAAIENVKILRTDARSIGEIFRPGSVDLIVINFPDPWSKARWLKHRLITPQLLQAAHTILKSNGVVRYKTDHREYFDSTVELVKELGIFEVSNLSYDLNSSLLASSNLQTEFEQLFNSQQKKICFLELTKH